MGTRSSFRGVNRPWHEADHSPPFSYKVNEWSYTVIPPVCLHDACKFLSLLNICSNTESDSHSEIGICILQQRNLKLVKSFLPLRKVSWGVGCVGGGRVQWSCITHEYGNYFISPMLGFLFD